MDPLPHPPSSLRDHVTVGVEREIPRGWEYHVAVALPGGAPRDHRVTLGFRDHDHWCGGAMPPSRVIQAVVEFLLARRIPLPAAFDAAKARYWVPTFDDELRDHL